MNLFGIVKKPEMKSGFVVFTTILIISAVALVVATTVGFMAIGESQSAFSLFKGEDTLYFVEGCMEDALLKARSDISYTGGNITRPEGTCTVSVAKVGTSWTLTTSTTDVKYKRSIQSVVNRLTTGITIVSWKEI